MDVLGKNAQESPKPQTKATKVSGYVNIPIPKKCATCEYLVNNALCKNKIVMTDKQVPFANRSKLKRVDPENGCCNLWTPGETTSKE